MKIMRNYDKATRRKLRELCGIAHERELSEALKKLHIEFSNWQAKKIDAFELKNCVHQFHQKTERQIWTRYSDTGFHDMLVSRALKLAELCRARAN
jgi:hypothetical protein